MRCRLFTLACFVSLLLAIALIVVATLTLDEGWKLLSWDGSARVHHDLYVRRGRVNLIHYMPTPFYQPPKIINGTLAMPREFIDFRVNLLPFFAMPMCLPCLWFNRSMRWRPGSPMAFAVSAATT